MLRVAFFLFTFSFFCKFNVISGDCLTDKDCVFHDWMSWQDCSGQCGNQMQIRQREFCCPEHVQNKKTALGHALLLWVRVANLMRADHVVCVMKVTLWRRAILVSAIMDTEDPAAGVGHFFTCNQFWNFLKNFYENQINIILFV